VYPGLGRGSYIPQVVPGIPHSVVYTFFPPSSTVYTRLPVLYVGVPLAVIVMHCHVDRQVFASS